MTVVLLASVSLFALVVTSRPILPSDADLSDFATTSSALQTSIQTTFRIHPGKDDPASDAARFHFQTSKQQQIEYLPDLDKEAAIDIASFQISPDEPPSFGAVSDETADERDSLDAKDEHDGTRADELAASQPAADDPPDEPPSAPLVVLVFSCVAAFLALACVALTLYIIKSLRSRMLASKTAWELLPRFWRRPKPENASATAKEHVVGRDCLLLQTERLLNAEEGSTQRHKLHPGDKPLYLDAVSDVESEWDDSDEKYQDALDMTPLPPIHNLPPEDNVSRPSHSGDPPSELRATPLDPPTADHSPSLMRELCPSPASRPAWSVRAMDSPALGLSSRQGGVDAAQQPLIHPHRRAYRSPVPELDIALAMQLRPGLGIGADSAWTVRFLMAIFGWFAVALSSNAR